MDETTDWKSNLSTAYNESLPKALLAVYIPINVLILVTNILVILTFIRTYRNGKFLLQHIYLVGLIGSDLITLTINSIGAGMLADGDVPLTLEACDALGNASTSMVCITVLIHCLMCVDRMIRIFAPFKYMEWNRPNRPPARRPRYIATGAVIACFILPVTVSLICRYAFMVDTYGSHFEPDIPDCWIHESGTNDNYGWILVTGLGAALMLQMVTGVIVIRAVKGLQGINRKRLWKATRTTAATVGLFYFCWIPGCVWVALRVDDSTENPPRWFTFLSVEMVALNSGLSFFIYYNMLPKFNATFRSLVGSTVSLVHRQDDSGSTTDSV